MLRADKNALAGVFSVSKKHCQELDGEGAWHFRGALSTRGTHGAFAQ